MKINFEFECFPLIKIKKQLDINKCKKGNIKRFQQTKKKFFFRRKKPYKFIKYKGLRINRIRMSEIPL